MGYTTTSRCLGLFLPATRDIRAVQKLLGHADFSTRLTYSYVLNGSAAAEFAARWRNDRRTGVMFAPRRPI